MQLPRSYDWMSREVRGRGWHAEANQHGFQLLSPTPFQWHHKQVTGEADHQWKLTKNINYKKILPWPDEFQTSFFFFVLKNADTVRIHLGKSLFFKVHRVKKRLVFPGWKKQQVVGLFVFVCLLLFFSTIILFFKCIYYLFLRKMATAYFVTKPRVNWHFLNIRKARIRVQKVTFV